MATCSHSPPAHCRASHPPWMHLRLSVVFRTDKTLIQEPWGEQGSTGRDVAESDPHHGAGLGSRQGREPSQATRIFRESDAAGSKPHGFGSHWKEVPLFLSLGALCFYTDSESEHSTEDSRLRGRVAPAQVRPPSPWIQVPSRRRLRFT